MTNDRIQELVQQLKSGTLSRRGFIQKATAAGASAAAAGMLATNALAQGATPVASPAASPAGIGEVITSITRAEYYEQLKSHFELEEPGEMGGLLVHTYTSDISTLNPILTSDIYSGLIIGFIFEGLVGNSPIDGSVVPSGFADSWEIAEDGVTYTFHLNPNATWQDGTPVTADDVVFTFDTVMSENSPSPRKSTVAQYLAEYRKIDDHTVQLVAIEQSAVFLDNTALQFAILPKHIWENVAVEDMPGDAGSTGQDVSRVVGSGPFRFAEWALGSQVVLEKNPDYWDQENVPYIDQYIFNVVEDTNTQIASLQAGETDMTAVSATRVDELRQSNPELQIAESDTASFTYYITNQGDSGKEMFKDVSLRQALHYALDRETFVETIMHGYATRAYGPQPVLSPAHAPDRMNTVYDFDPEMARSLLDEAGWVPGDDGIREKDGERLSFEMMYTETAAIYEQGIPFIQQYWREVGVEMLPAAMPFPTLLERINAANYETAILGFTWGFDGLQGDMFACDFTPPNGFNWQRYCNPEYDELDAQAQVELDDERRIDLIIEATNIANDDAAVGVVEYDSSILGANPRLHNFLPQGYSGFWWLRWGWLESGS